MESDVVVLKDLASELEMDRSHLRRFVLGLNIDPFFVRTQESRNQATLAVSVEEAEKIRSARIRAGFLGGPEPTPFRKTTSDSGESEEMIGQNIRTAEGLEAFRRANVDYVRDFVREAAIPNKVIPPTPVTIEDMVPGFEEQDAKDVYVWRDRAGGTGLLPGIGIEGTNDDVAHYIEKHRYAVPIDAITTETYERTFPEIIAAGYNMHAIIKQTIALETLRRKNHAFMSYCEMAVASTGRVIEVEGAPSTDDLLALRLSLRHPTDEIELSETVLIGEVDLAEMRTREGKWGEGAIKAALTPMRLISSMEAINFPTFDDDGKPVESAIWLFAKPDKLGDNLYHGDYTIWAKWEGSVLHFQGWELAGFGIKDIRGITKVIVKY